MQGINIETWPKVDPDMLDGAVRPGFERRRRALQLYLNNESHKEIRRSTGIGRQELYRLIERCMATAKDGRLAGFRGLVPHWHIRKRLPLVLSKEERPKTLPGAFGAILNAHPSLESKLRRNIQRYARSLRDADKRYISLREIHGEFLKDCVNLGISQKAYPLCTTDQAYRAICRFAKNVRLQKTRASRITDEDARLRGDDSLGSVPRRPLSRVELDGTPIDFAMTIAITSPLDGAQVYRPISSMWIIVLLDVATKVILGYSVSFGKNYRTSDVIAAVRSALSPWRPRQLRLKMLEYPEGGGLPFGVIPQYDYACFDELHLDNALAHLSPGLLRQLEERIGCVPIYGPRHKPNARSNVESLFLSLSQRYFWRTPTSTRPGKQGRGERKAEADAEAIRLQITQEDLYDLVDVTIATYNAERSSHSMQSRLWLLRAYLAAEFTLVARVPHAMRTRPWLDIEIERTVHGGPGTNHAPYINFESVRYTNIVLQSSPHLVGTKLRILASSEDMRYVESYLPSGDSLGLLRAERRWAETKHSRETRKAINALRREHPLPGPEHLDLPARFTLFVKQRAAHSKREATRLAKLRREQSLDSEFLDSDQAAIEPEEPSDPLPHAKNSLEGFGTLYFKRR